MKVSIIVPVYNSQDFIVRCINSIINQNYQDIEAVIVNDGSTDNSSEILSAYERDHDWIKVIDQKNSGTLMSRLNGIAKSTGDVVLNLDADDFLESNAVELLVNEMKKKNADIIIGDHYELLRGRKNIKKNQVPSLQTPVEYYRYLLLGKLSGYIWGRLIKRSLFENIKLTTKRAYSEDVLINFLLLSQEGIKVSILDQPIVNYVIHDSNISQSINSLPVEGFFHDYVFLEQLLDEVQLKKTLSKELAAYKCRSWVVYCRKGGAKSKDPNYHRNFFRTNYPMAKNYLPLYQKIEMICYAKNLRLGSFTSELMKWIQRNIIVSKYIKTI